MISRDKDEMASRHNDNANFTLKFQRALHTRDPAAILRAASQCKRPMPSPQA